MEGSSRARARASVSSRNRVAFRYERPWHSHIERLRSNDRPFGDSRPPRAHAERDARRDTRTETTDTVFILSSRAETAIHASPLSLLAVYTRCMPSLRRQLSRERALPVAARFVPRRSLFLSLSLSLSLSRRSLLKSSRPFHLYGSTLARGIVCTVNCDRISKRSPKPLR